MTDMMRDSVRRLLARNTPLTLAWLNLGDLTIVDAAARSGADALALDLQHGLWTREKLELAVTVAGEVPVIVRVADNAPVPISEALDAGAEAVVVPMIETVEAAAQAVAFSRFAPDGMRSGGGIRPIAAGFTAYVAATRTRTLVGIMIETARGLANVDAIAAVPGVDFIFIGTGDLAVSLGVAAGSETLEAAFETIRKASAAAGLPCGLYTRTPDEARRRAADGHKLVVVSNDIGLVFSGFAAAMAAYRG